MGLDSVELIVEVENEFQIEILDIEAENILTVGDFYECVIQKLAFSPDEINQARCKSQEYFYELRKVLIEDFQQERKTISPKTSLHAIFEKKKIRASWKILAEKIEVKMPDLERPKWMNNLIIWTFLILGISVSIIGIISGHYYLLGIWIMVVYALEWLFKLTEPFAIHSNIESLGELVNAIISENYRALVLSKSSKNDIYLILQGIISEKVGVPIKDIKYNAKIVDDLGID